VIDLVDFPPMKSAAMAGQAGEFLTTYLLVRAGLQAIPVDVYGPDIWCRFPNGAVRTIEVKTAQSVSYRLRGGRRPSYAYHVPRREADIYAFVALDKERVLFKLPEDIPKYTTIRLSPEEFSIRNIQDSLSLLIPDYNVRSAA